MCLLLRIKGQTIFHIPELLDMTGTVILLCSVSPCYSQCVRQAVLDFVRIVAVVVEYLVTDALDLKILGRIDT